MQKFIAIFSVPAATMDDWMKNTSEEERKTGMETMMQEWNEWKETHKDSLGDFELPLGKTKRVMKDSVQDIRNDLNYLMTIEAESHEAAAELLKDNPHFKYIPESYADVMSTQGPSQS